MEGKIPPELPLRPEIGEHLPDEKSVERGKFRSDRSLSNVTNATLTVYLPPIERASGAAALICPGGGS